MRFELTPRHDPDRQPTEDEIGAMSWACKQVFLGDTSSAEYIRMFKSATTIPSVEPLLKALETLEHWEVVQFEEDGDPPLRAAFTAETLRKWLLMRFAASLIDRRGWYSASWFRDQFGILPGRLRARAHRGQLPTKKDGKTVLYSLSVARELWPEDIWL